MNTPTKAAIALAALTLVWAGGTAYSGQALQKALESAGPMGDAGEQDIVKVVGRQYEKTFLGATRTLQLQLGCAADGQTPLNMTWRDRIEHGPLPGFTTLGGARIRSEIELDAATKAELKARIGSESLPVDIVTLVGLTGGRSTTLSGHDIRMTDAKSGMQLALLGLKATIDTSGSETRLRYELGSYTVADPRVRMEMQGLSGTSRGPSPHWYALATEGEGTLKLMTVRRNDTEAANAKPLLQLKDMRVKQTSRTDGELYSTQVSFNTSGEAGGHKLDAVQMKMAFKNLHGPSYAKLMAALAAPYYSCGQAAQADPAQALLARTKPMQDAFMALLPHNPSLALEDLSVTYAGQTAKFSYALGTQGVTADEVKAGFGPALVRKFGFNARAEAPVAMVKAIAQTQNQPPEMVDGMLAQGVAQGMLQRKGEVVVMEAVAANGQFKLNGRPMPIPGLSPAAPAAESAPAAP